MGHFAPLTWYIVASPSFASFHSSEIGVTTLVAFVAIDPRGPAAFYLASDSRISWRTDRERWDAGRKVFACQSYPHVFGYFGDVLFPSVVLSQVVELIDRGALFDESDTPQDCHAKIVASVKGSFARRQHTPDESFSILHGLRQFAGLRSAFFLWQVSYDKTNRSWADNHLTIPLERSSLVQALGTGAAAIREHVRRWNASEQGGTTRAVYAAFCDALRTGQDGRSGGAPQLVGIYRIGPAKTLAVVHEGIRYFNGLPIPDGVRYKELEWRDELFQRLDGETLEVLTGAQRHSRPVL
jgi:hypothetical protein